MGGAIPFEDAGPLPGRAWSGGEIERLLFDPAWLAGQTREDWETHLLYQRRRVGRLREPNALPPGVDARLLAREEYVLVVLKRAAERAAPAEA